MTDFDLVAHGYTGNTRIADIHQLRTDVEAIGGTFPEALTNLLAVNDLLRSTSQPLPAARGHLTPLAEPVLDAAVAGDLTETRLDEIVFDAALARVVAETRGEITRAAQGSIVLRAGKMLAEGAADEIVLSLRPQFDEAARTIERALELVDLSHDYETFFDHADMDKLDALHALKPACDEITRIVDVAARFGRKSLSFPLIGTPQVGGSAPVEDLYGLADAALFSTDPEFGVSGLLSVAMAIAEHNKAISSQRTVNPQDMGMRAKFGPFARGALRLNTVTEARDLLRAWAEVKTDNLVSPEHLAILGNPYRVEVSPLDDDERFPYGKPTEAN